MTANRSVPLEVLVVGWFPAADDTSAGRFVADQVAALQASGAVRSSVVAFENAAVRGAAALCGREAAAAIANVGAAIRVRSPFNEHGAAGPLGVPLARLGVAAGEAPGAGADHRAVHRAAALLPLVDRVGPAGWDLVHAHVGYPEGAVAAQAATRLGVPLILTEHATFLASMFAEPVVRARYRETALAAARVVAVSRMLADELVAAFPELAGRVVVIPNTVAVEEFGGGSPVDRVAGELLWVGNRTETKGIATLLRAFAIVREKRPGTALRLVGRSFRPEHEAGWQRLAAELGVADAVRFEPPADRAGVAAAMRRADLFVHPSTRETFGVVAVEALASGLPVVATDSGGVGEVLGDDPDRLGALVPASDPAALAAAIDGVLERRASFDPAVLRAHAEEHFGAARVAGRIVELYEAVLAEHAGRARTDSRPGTGPAGPGERGGDGGGGSAGAGSRLGPAAVLPTRTVVVGFSRAEPERAIARFPAWVLDGVMLVTSGGRLDGRSDARLAPSGTEARIAELLDWGAPTADRFGRLARRLRRVRRTILAVGDRRPDPARSILADLGRTLDAALPAGAGPDAPLIVCLGGLDHLVAAPFIAAGRAVAAPGGLRWLADARATAQTVPAAPTSSDA